MLFGEIERRGLQRAKKRTDFADRRLDVKPQIERDLIIAAAGSVQLCSGRADSFRERGLDIHVYILERLVPLKLAGFDFLFDRAQSIVDLVSLFRCDDSSLGERGGVRD